MGSKVLEADVRGAIIYPKTTVCTDTLILAEYSLAAEQFQFRTVQLWSIPAQREWCGVVVGGAENSFSDEPSDGYDKKLESSRHC
jgi:hypothetical protein